MRVEERAIRVPAPAQDENPLNHVQKSVTFQMDQGDVPVRYTVVSSSEHQYCCEIGVLVDATDDIRDQVADLFKFRQRMIETTDTFNAVLLIPTGIGAEIGGHAGDATAVARLMSGVCDTVILHPNVVNASDINEQPDNSLYVEGSIITRLLMGTVGLQPTRANRILVLLDEHPDKHFIEAAVNSVSASRATYGLNIPEVVCLNPPVRMFAEYAESGRAVGRVENLGHCLDVLHDCEGSYDAVALASVIRVPQEYHLEYFESEGSMVNPWGGVEAMLTHTISSILDVPTAHSPMMESRTIENIEAGIVEPRMAAEAVSLSYLNCVLKGLQRSPRLVSDENLFSRSDVFSVEDVSCLVIPDGCLGLPTVAALEQGITVIAVRENRNLMRNDLSRLPWKKGQFISVENYLEAIGVINALKVGVTLESVRRPISRTSVRHSAELDDKAMTR